MLTLLDIQDLVERRFQQYGIGPRSNEILQIEYSGRFNDTQIYLLDTVNGYKDIYVSPDGTFTLSSLKPKHFVLVNEEEDIDTTKVKKINIPDTIPMKTIQVTDVNSYYKQR